MPRHRDDGVATVWAAIVITALAALLAAVVGFGAAVAARHRATAAADLAALAGAAQAWSGPEVACATATDVASQMGSEVRACELTGLEITIRVARPFAGFGWAEATARAGPVDAVATSRH
ncbi:Rv3654c family TadE-like protein [Actinokineospora sp. UTMC 2448]|uniref:Rv3654c family TadE-like protein n=1 Tax=Actinokineospora sp. UTMC 2448 TaxID=2268449 RepID=UPI0021645AED|nr:Rv3654c family TadE-like protein [Actinokineospora sp. UTMC 2448]UVS76607.1 helicase/secretion neighborhood TadE-like protein [Actinokineospora sp. UTMC 2448]